MVTQGLVTRAAAHKQAALGTLGRGDPGWSGARRGAAVGTRGSRWWFPTPLPGMRRDSGCASTQPWLCSGVGRSSRDCSRNSAARGSEAKASVILLLPWWWAEGTVPGDSPWLSDCSAAAQGRGSGCSVSAMPWVGCLQWVAKGTDGAAVTFDLFPAFSGKLLLTTSHLIPWPCLHQEPLHPNHELVKGL